MEEVFELRDYVTIMRVGEFVSAKPVLKVSHNDIITMMVGRKNENDYPERESEIGDVVFDVRNISCGQVYQDVSLNVRRGEIVGFAGLVGAERTEIMSGIGGLLDPIGCFIYKCLLSSNSWSTLGSVVSQLHFNQGGRDMSFVSSF